MPTPGPNAEDESAADIEVDEGDHAPPPEPAAVSRYLAHLHAHNTEVRSYLLGHPQIKEHHLAPSFFAPNAFWTVKEKDQFFHALSVHSRLRPDLIAEEIGTKTLADVCAYIDMLEDGLRQSGAVADDSAADVIPEYLDFERLPREDFPIAYEVCDEWVAFEESLAEAAAAQEPVMVAESLQKARDEEAHQFQLQIRARKGTAKLADNSRDRVGEKLRKQQYKEWLEQKRKAWKEEDALNGMDVDMMKAIDMLIREYEETKGLVQQEEPDKVNDEVAPSVAEPAEANSAPANSWDQPSKVVGDFDEELIDPILRASSSAPTAVHTPQPEGPDRIHTPDPSAFDPHDLFRPRTPPFMHLRPSDSSSTLIGHENNALFTPSVAGSSSMAPSEADAQLSPASRRRFMKRMYMRRKRAEKSGGVVEETTARLKPGRKPLKRPGETVDENEPTRHPRFSGKPRQAKMKDDLVNAGITAEWLEHESLNLFHFGAFHKLMRIYQSLHDVPDSVVSEISIHTLRLLRDELVQFLFRIVQHVVISREQEMKAKMHTKVWRLAENQVVTAANVAHAVSLLGLEHHDKKAHFQDLLSRLGLAEEIFSDDEGAEHDSPPVKRSKGKQKATSCSDIEPEDETTPATLPPLLQGVPVHRLVFPPYVRLPGGVTQVSSDSMLSYIPWAHGMNTDDPEEVSDVDEDALELAEAHDLLQEAELDKLDRSLAKEHEDALFDEFGIHQEKRTITDASGTWDVSRVEKRQRPLQKPGGRRKRRRTTTGTTSRKKRKVKTAEFVFDTEEEDESEATSSEEDDRDEEVEDGGLSEEEEVVPHDDDVGSEYEDE